LFKIVLAPEDMDDYEEEEDFLDDDEREICQ
jgi:hypothetical protein